MISLEKVREALEAGASLVALDEAGELQPVPDGAEGPAMALVRPVSDALKSVTGEGLIAGSIDRDDVWAVELLVLSEAVVGALSGELDSIQEVYLEVESAGFDWRLSPMPSVP